MILHQFSQCFQRLRIVLANDDSFAGTQPGGFDHQGKGLSPDIIFCLDRIRKTLIAGRRCPVLHHEALGKILGSFQLSFCLTGSENGQSPGPEQIRNPFDQGTFRPDNRQIYPMGGGKLRHRRVLRQLQAATFGFPRNSWISRDCHYFLHQIRLSQFPGQSMFPPA
ncbi:hypothetical protein SDC9_151740 [bioreactor metagenome]|uniref:Uncharacterized protein n=1 Tax=bioreactor metagenome TaxID=1076179 RepID=A0A645ETG9_9ZZZZ